MTAFRHIELRHPPVSPPYQGPRPDLQWVSIGDLVIDDSYQRPLSDRSWLRISKIAQNFDWGRFSPCLVAPALGADGSGLDGKFALIDGQHRTHAALMAGVGVVPCMVADLRTTQAQASAFAWVNGEITQMSPMQVYKAALAAGEKWAVEASGAVDGVWAPSGDRARLMTYPKGPSTRKAREVYSIGLIRRNIELGRAVAVSEAVGALLDSQHADDVFAWGDMVLSALIAARVAIPALRRAQFHRFLDQADLHKTADDVQRLLRDPRYAGRSRKSLFGEAVLEMARGWIDA